MKLNDWEKEEIIRKDKIAEFDFLSRRRFITEVSMDYYYLSEDIKTVEMELWKDSNARLANELDIQDIDKEIKRFIKLLNSYNEIKDIGQELIGKIADLRQTTAKAIHEELGMDLD